MFYDYADSGSWTESTYRANEADFQRIKLRQRVAVNMENRSIAHDDGRRSRWRCRWRIAPTGLTGMQHADGEILAARAAEKFGVPFTLSTMSICSIEDVAANTTAPFWFQLYVMRDRDFIERLIDRARGREAAARWCSRSTCRSSASATRTCKNGLSAPPKPTLANLINLATKPRWCLGMLGTKRRSFGNIVGHVEGRRATSARCRVDRRAVRPGAELGRRRVDQEALGRQADPQGHPGRRGRAARRRQRRRRADRLQPRRPPARRRAVAPSRRCRRSSRRSARRSKSGWTAASARARTCSRPWRSAPSGTLIGRAFLYGLGAMGEAGVTRAWRSSATSSTSRWPSAAAPTSSMWTIDPAARDLLPPQASRLMKERRW